MSQGMPAERVRANWGWFLALGVGLTVLGIIALGATVTTTVVSVLFLGWLLLFGGIIQAISAFWAGSVGGALLRVVMGILFFLAGLYLITKPVIGALTITLVIAGFLLVEGVVRIVTAIAERYDGWIWSIVGGAIALALGVLLLVNWPVTGTFAIGLFIAIDLLLYGVSWIVAAFVARSYSPPAQKAAAI